MNKIRSDGQLTLGGASLAAAAAQYGTPAYVYDRAAIEQAWLDYDQALAGHPHLICYAVKANSNLAILNVLARLGAGFDIVSGGELERVIAAGGQAGRIVFSGVGKTPAEMRRALALGIRCFNVESLAELQRLNAVAGEMGVAAPVSLRVNPDVDAKTHPYISTGLKENKFGIEVDAALEAYRTAASLQHIRIAGLDCHIGSQLTEVQPFVDALKRVLALVDQLDAEGIALQHLDLGGGLGIAYTAEDQPPSVAELMAAILGTLGERSLELIFEPGRSIVGNAGVLLTTVEYLKHTAHKNFAIVDAAMNDLMRPALYSAWQEIVPVQEKPQGEARQYDVVGPICETGDFLGKDRELVLAEGDVLAVMSAGAYGFTMASNYNTRPRAVELMADHGELHVIRQRERFAQLIAGEQLLPE
ncbi:MAG: diaminopimelate decarboxylase [Gammaproteobacteria bacterium]|nr:MAG: diaminopimelate decarboxylase [Gammaproteobacteria bacterium]